MLRPKKLQDLMGQLESRGVECAMLLTWDGSLLASSTSLVPTASSRVKVIAAVASNAMRSLSLSTDPGPREEPGMIFLECEVSSDPYRPRNTAMLF